MEETNRYYQQTSSPPDFETSAAELKAYFGFMILMGLCQLPKMRDYWAKSEQLHYSPISSRISRSRFEAITRNLHFANNECLLERGDPGYDKLQKIRPVITHLSATFLSLYIPHQNTSIDEAMIPFKGKLYVPNIKFNMHSMKLHRILVLI